MFLMFLHSLDCFVFVLASAHNLLASIINGFIFHLYDAWLLFHAHRRACQKQCIMGGSTIRYKVLLAVYAKVLDKI